MYLSQWLCTFLDDVYLVTTRERAREAFDAVAASIKEGAGIDINMGKCRAWSAAGGDPPPGIAELGTSVWCGDRSPEENGLVVLGAPLGTAEYIASKLQARRDEERLFLDRLQAVPDLQSAWLLLSYCAAPRANHILRLLPPATSSDYAEGHDEDVWTALNGLLSQHERVIDKGGPAAPTAIAAARSTNQPVASEARTRSLATLPGSFGGLGLRAASRAAAGAYWAAWVDALPVLAARAPVRTAQILSALEGSGAASACTEAANFCRDFLVAQGMEGLPSWAEAVAGARPGTNRDELPREPGEWHHGWQFFACRASEIYYLRHALEPTLSPQHLTKLGSQSGRFASRAFSALPTSAGMRSRSSRFLVSLRRRLWLPLPLLPLRCPGASCRKIIDTEGDHLAACPHTGLLKRRARPLERAWAQVFREAGARVADDQKLRDMAIPGILPSDRREIEIVAYDLPLFHGSPLCCDATIVSAIRADGHPAWSRHHPPGKALLAAESRKRSTYRDVEAGRFARLLVLGCELGGRWSKDASSILFALADARAEQAPALLRGQVKAALVYRWSALIAVTVQDTVAATLTGAGCGSLQFAATSTPTWGDLDRLP